MSITVVILVVLQAVLMVGLPIAAAVWLKRRWHLPWSLILAGAVTFVASQILHIPTNALLSQGLNIQAQPLVVQAAILGLSAGIFEEVARYLAYRYWREDARSWREATFFGLGHGGIEAIITGVLVALTLINMITVVSVEDPATLGLPEGAMAQVEAYWAMPAYLPALAVAERVMAILLHLGLSALVVLSFHRESLWPLGAAILWHALVDGLVVYTVQTRGIVASELMLAVISIGSIGLIWWTYRVLPERRNGARTL